MTRRSLAWRLYALGILQLALVLAAALLVAILDAPAPPPRDAGRRIEEAAARLGPMMARPPEIAAEMEELRRAGMSATLLDAAGRVLASNVEPPLRAPPGPPARGHHPPGPPPGPPPPGLDPGMGPPPPPPPDLVPGLLPPPAAFDHEPPPGGPPDRLVVARVPDGDGARLVARFERPKRDLRVPLFTLGVGLLIVGIGALLMARWLVRPLEQLSRTARALGEGDLRARTGLSRSDEVGEVGRAFDEMAGRVERLVRAEKELLANVSHELRTPLARIRVALDLAEEGDAPAARAALAEIAVDLAELEALLADVFTAARMEVDGKAAPAELSLHLEPVPAGSLAERAAERFRARHPDRALELRIEDGLPEVTADPALLRRAIDNLLENAHKYTPEGDRPVALRAWSSGARVGFEVKDRGAGIAAADLPHVFEPFFRGERSRSRAAGGVGLGLTLAKRIVAAHGGTIEVDSVPGEGTTVRIDVPVGADRALELPAASSLLASRP